MYLESVPNWFLNVGFITHLASGPVLFLYFAHLLKAKKWLRFQYLHFVPIVFLLLFLFKIDESNFWYQGGYSFLLYHQLAYTVLTFHLLLRVYKRRRLLTFAFSKKEWNWLFILMIGVSFLQLAYFSNYVLQLTPYSAGPIIYAFFIYVISGYTVFNGGVSGSRKEIVKYRNINMDAESFELYKNKVREIMELEKPFLSSSFSLEQLSQFISLPTYLTSHIINKGFNKNFSDFINSYRISEAKSKLSSSIYGHIKIAEIAYECGFNSLSSFNNAFKKNTGTTPSGYRKTAE
ncbi:MAG: AraC family transcriptional regulator [Bacteroidota bacterium]